MSKNIFRQKRTSNFTVVPNEFLHSSNLSFKAKGILSYLLSLPADWELHVSQLATIASDGRESVYNGILELVEAKYIWRRPRSGTEPGGWEYFVYDSPKEQSPFDESPHTENPNAENPNTAFPESGKPATTKYYNKEQRTKERKDTRTTEEFVEYLKTTYDWVDVDIELKKIDAWLVSHPDRKKTRRFVEKWIARSEKPMPKQQPNALGITKGYRPCL